MHIVSTRPFNLGRNLNAFFLTTGRGPSASAGTWIPRVDIYEANGTLNIRFELAGLNADDLEVTLEDGLLKVSGSRSFDVPEDAEFHSKELSRGEFSRTLRVTNAYDAERVNASFVDGLLDVRLEKRPEVLPKTIEIEAR